MVSINPAGENNLYSDGTAKTEKRILLHTVCGVFYENPDGTYDSFDGKYMHITTKQLTDLANEYVKKNKHDVMKKGDTTYRSCNYKISNIIVEETNQRFEHDAHGELREVTRSGPSEAEIRKYEEKIGMRSKDVSIFNVTEEDGYLQNKNKDVKFPFID